MITKTIEQHEPKIGTISLVGVPKGPYPLPFGNYFSLRSGLRITNMWAENLQEWERQNPADTIEVTVFAEGKHRLGIITDPRIPPEWLLKDNLCVTGYGWGSNELAESVRGFVNEHR